MSRGQRLPRARGGPYVDTGDRDEQQQGGQRQVYRLEMTHIILSSLNERIKYLFTTNNKIKIKYLQFRGNNHHHPERQPVHGEGDHHAGHLLDPGPREVPVLHLSDVHPQHRCGQN